MSTSVFLIILSIILKCQASLKCRQCFYEDCLTSEKAIECPEDNVACLTIFNKENHSIYQNQCLRKIDSANKCFDKKETNRTFMLYACDWEDECNRFNWNEIEFLSRKNNKMKDCPKKEMNLSIIWNLMSNFFSFIF